MVTKADRPTQSFRVYGAHSAHPRAPELAEKVHALLFRYASEVVAAYGLCPFLRDVETGMGAVGVVLDVEPDVETSAKAIEDLGANVVHLVYPISKLSSSGFERFGSKLAKELDLRLRERLVHATFHPELTGGTENAHRLVGLLRQAPDPFVQFIPPGLHEGGTVMAGEAIQAHQGVNQKALPAEGRAEATYSRLFEGPAGSRAVEQVLSRLGALREARSVEYASLANEISRPLP